MLGFLAGFAIAWTCDIIDRVKRGSVWYDDKIKGTRFTPPPKPY